MERPTIHPDFDLLLQGLDALAGFENIAVTTNGSKLVEKAPVIASKKVKQLNISLDSVNNESFRRITRTGNLSDVVAGIDAAKAVGIKRIRLNTVVSSGANTDELVSLLQFAVEKECHIAFIEEMPLGDMETYSRSDHYLSNDEALRILSKQFSLAPLGSELKPAGPATYYQVKGALTEVGFTSPHSNNFCAQCNRVRLTRKGELILCLGQESVIDLKAVLRDSKPEKAVYKVKEAIVAAMLIKPDSHEFDAQNDGVQVVRFMNVTGG